MSGYIRKPNGVKRELLEPAPIGHNGAPASPEERAARERFLREQITLYIGDRRIEHALEQEELAQLEGIERFLTLHKGLLLNLITQCQVNPNMSPASAVLALITALSDNNAAICTLTTVRMAQLLGRQDDRSIRRA